MHGIIESVVSDAKYDCVYINCDGNVIQFVFPAKTVGEEHVGKTVRLVKHEGKDWAIQIVRNENK